MIARLKAGTLSAQERDALVESFLPMARNVARKLAPSGKEDDYTSAAYEGIEYAFRNVGRMYDENLELWVKSCIYRFVKEYQCTDHLVRIPYSTVKRMKKNGETVVFLKRQCLSPKVDRVGLHSAYEDMLEWLEFSTKTEEDRNIVSLRLESYKDNEIGKLMEKSRAYINKRRCIIEKLFFSCLAKC